MTLSETRYRYVNEWKLKKLRKILKQVNSYKATMRLLTDKELQEKTIVFRKQLKLGKTLEQLLPEAFAAMREADYRILGMFPFDVQVLGGIAMHYGYIAEMKTGEGKTLTATLPLYLNGLTGKGAMLVTVSDYLSRRDYNEMLPVYQFMGLHTSLGFFTEEEEDLVKKKIKTAAEIKREIYGADIIYTTNGALGFDYLIDNLAGDASGKYLRKYYYAIVDEVDAVLLDGAQTPFIISGSPRVQSNLYELVAQFVNIIEKNIHYKTDAHKKAVWLTTKGIKEAERFFDIANLYDRQHFMLVRHLSLALAAEIMYEKGRDYVVEMGEKNLEVMLIDSGTGRVLEGTKLQAGIHQAIEAKEGTEISPEMRAMGSVTLQNFFNLFPKLAGMTGTGLTDKDEFIETYHLNVIRIPTHRPIIRKDKNDLIFATIPEKVVAIIETVKSYHAIGRPVLLIVSSVLFADLYSKILLREGIAHNVLTATQAAKEALIIKEAGQFGAVTVATTMAGRGTDIKLGPGVESIGGLAVVVTERMSTKRFDDQVRGRAGRQGDPGSSEFFVCLEDDLIEKYGSERLRHSLKKIEPTGQPITKNFYRKGVKVAQKASESFGRSARRTTKQFDEVLRKQRALVYQQRDDLIFERVDVREYTHKVLEKVVTQFIATTSDMSVNRLKRFILDNMTFRYVNKTVLYEAIEQNKIKETLLDICYSELKNKSQLMSEDEMIQFYRLSVLKAIDECWIQQVDHLQQLRLLVVNRDLAQRNPFDDYQKEALKGFDIMRETLQHQVFKNVLLSSITRDMEGQVSIYFD